ncbi:MAG: protoporphyrinogen oxidase, partial [bacterium]|nr:protoporphyrinogen oxidase [Candidatus Kapabacteria bacterium]
SATRVVIATNALVAASLVRNTDHNLASELGSIAYPPIATIVSMYRREHVRHPLDGFGCLVPEVEKRKILGIIFSSSLFPNRAPEGMVSVTTMIGGARQPDLASLRDAELSTIIDDEHRSLLGISHSAVSIDITRWSAAIPQYDLNHARMLATIETAERNHHGLYLAGNYRGGVSIGDCVRSAHTIAERISS